MRTPIVYPLIVDTNTTSRCRGLKVLVDLLDEDYNEQTDLVVHALNGIGSVFELQSPTTKNDFCRMFIRDGLLDPLSAALLNVMGSREGSAAEMKMKIIQILLVFSQVSQSDIHVRNAMGTRKIIRSEYSNLASIGNLVPNSFRTVACLRITGTRLSCPHAQGCQALVHERHTIGCPAECQRHRNPDSHLGRTKRGCT